MSFKSGPAPTAELLCVNGRIHTLATARPAASVLAARGGELVYVGDSHEEGRALLSPEARLLDLGGRTVIPGLIDSHLHLLSQGRRLSEIDIFLKSKEEILEIVFAEAQQLGPDAWIVGRGWNHEAWRSRQWPRKEDLDAVAPANPVALTRADAHSLWANSLALRKAGLDRRSQNPAGGEILRAADGDLLGILIDTAIFHVWAVLPPLDGEQKRKAFGKAQEELFKYGITSVGDAWQTPGDQEILKQAYAAGELKVRVYGMLASVGGEGDHPLDNDLAPEQGLFAERLSLRAFKVVLDGSLGSRSAWLNEEYADRPGHRGSGRYSDEEFYALILPAARRGFQVCAHAIGDAAVQQAIRVFEKIGHDHPDAAPRHRIEHFQIVSPDDVARTVSLGIFPAMQTVQAATDRDMAQARLAGRALAHSYPWRAILDAGGLIANGTDCPIERINPFSGIHAAVARTPFIGQESEKAERLALTREEALLSYTLWAAAAEHGEGRKGSLEPGKLADFAVLDRDILTCPEEAVQNVEVLMTVLGGEVVYENTAAGT